MTATLTQPETAPEVIAEKTPYSPERFAAEMAWKVALENLHAPTHKVSEPSGQQTVAPSKLQTAKG